MCKTKTSQRQGQKAEDASRHTAKSPEFLLGFHGFVNITLSEKQRLLGSRQEYYQFCKLLKTRKVYLVKDWTLLKPENNATQVLNLCLFSWGRIQARWDNRSQTRGLHRQSSTTEQKANSAEGQAESNYFWVPTTYYWRQSTRPKQSKKPINNFRIKYSQPFEIMHKPFLYSWDAEFLRNSEVFNSGNTFQNIPDYSRFSSL